MIYPIQQSIIWLLLALGVLGNLGILMILKFEKSLRTFTKMMFTLQVVADLMWITWQVIFIAYVSLQPSPIPFILTLINIMLAASIICSLWCVAVVALEQMCLVVWPTNPIIRRAAFKESAIVYSSLVLFSLVLSAIGQFLLNFDAVWKIVLGYILDHFLPLFVSFLCLAVFLHKIKTSSRRVNCDEENQLTRPSLLPIQIVGVASTFTFIVHIPMMCLTIKQFHDKFENPLQGRAEVNIWKWFQLVWFSNFTLKVFFYTIIIPHFRKSFVDICKKAKNKFIRN